MIRRPPRSTQSRSSAASDVYKRQVSILWIVFKYPIIYYLYGFIARHKDKYPSSHLTNQIHYDMTDLLKVWILCHYSRIVYLVEPCLLYTSDAADDLLCVDLGGRRIIKKKNNKNKENKQTVTHSYPHQTMLMSITI